MSRLIYDAASSAYFAFDVRDESTPLLTELRWSPHMGAARCWYTRSPYLAAPFWSWVGADDATTRAALGPFSWNYATSFAREPIKGCGVDQIRLPAGSKPYPFQLAGIQRAMLRQRTLIADEPGCGKSLQALGVANLLRPSRIVIGCPTFLVDNWSAECEKWLVDAQSITIAGRGKRGMPAKGVIILPYSRGHVYAEQVLKTGPVDYLIADEPEALKSPSARRTLPWLGEAGLFAAAKRAVVIGGSPIPNNPLEIHGLLQALSPETMGAVSREKFKEAYCSSFKGVAKVQGKRGGEIAVEFEKISGRNEAALNAELRASGVMVRRMKDDVLEQLPKKMTFLVHLTPTAEIETLVREETTLYEMLETKLMTPQEQISLQGHIANVRARLGLLKAPKIAEYVKFLFDTGEKRVVLFMLHLAAIEAVRKVFENSRVRVHVLTGAETARQRNESVVEFQKNTGYELIVGQMTAAGVGLTMTAARDCVLGEISWNPQTNNQAIDRVHRISQTRTVHAAILTFPHAVEERVLRSTAQKQLSTNRIMDDNLQNTVLTG